MWRRPCCPSCCRWWGAGPGWCGARGGCIAGGSRRWPRSPPRTETAPRHASGRARQGQTPTPEGSSHIDSQQQQQQAWDEMRGGEEEWRPPPPPRHGLSPPSLSRCVVGACLVEGSLHCLPVHRPPLPLPLVAQLGQGLGDGRVQRPAITTTTTSTTSRPAKASLGMRARGAGGMVWWMGSLLDGCCLDPPPVSHLP